MFQLLKATTEDDAFDIHDFQLAGKSPLQMEGTTRKPTSTPELTFPLPPVKIITIHRLRLKIEPHKGSGPL